MERRLSMSLLVANLAAGAVESFEMARITTEMLKRWKRCSTNLWTKVPPTKGEHVREHVEPDKPWPRHDRVGYGPAFVSGTSSDDDPLTELCTICGKTLVKHGVVDADCDVCTQFTAPLKGRRFMAVDLTKEQSMEHLEQYFYWMGRRVKDRVRGITGIVTSINFDLYGCIQCAVSPVIGPDGKLPEQAWVDVQRLIEVDNPVTNLPDGPVIPLPDYVFSTKKQEGQNGPPGAAEKPDFNKE